MTTELVTIRTADGESPTYVCSPDTGEPASGVILYSDALGMRPTIVAMAERLAALGYVVLAPDLFYRAGSYAPLDPRAVFASEDMMASIGPLIAATDTARATADTAAFLAYLHGRDDVLPGKVGTTGYCMGGALSLTVAGAYPDHVGAAASFHAGNLVTDTPLSPHLRMPTITGQVYIAGADHDAGYPPEMAAAVDNLLTKAGVTHRMEVYPDALHGFTMTDCPVYDEAAAERHWQELRQLLAEALPA